MLLKIMIVEEFMKDYTNQLTGSQIAKKNNLNQKTVSNYLLQLEEEHILKSQTQGKNKLYSLNKDNKEIIKNFILATEHLKTIQFYKKNLLIKEVVEKILPYIKGTAIIFGSYAKGTQKKHSDIDILIIGRSNEKRIDEISRTYNVELNLKTYPKFKLDILTREALKNHIIIKNGELVIEEALNE